MADFQGTRRRAVSAGAVAWGLLSFAQVAQAAGWDTPIVHTARHQGMGGTAISSVDDPSASFHNPAGYAGVDSLEAIASFSLLVGNLTSSPAAHSEATNVQSETILAPFPLLAVGARVHDWVTIGVGAYPVASGAASYAYPASTGGEIEDRLRAVFVEVSPGASLNIPEELLGGQRLSLGAGYRVTSVSFTRYQASEANAILDLELNGSDFAGFRVGLQYDPLETLHFGLVYRNKVELEAGADSGRGLGQEFQNPSLGFVLPSKMGAGARFDPWRFSVAFDYEFAWQSQNDVVALSGVPVGEDEVLAIDNHFYWQDGHTARLGLEYRAPVGEEVQIPIRAGYVFDGQVGNEDYPTPFGTPPTTTHSVTAGAGFQRGPFQVNVATAFRTGAVEVVNRASECVFCGYPGDYKLSLVGGYVDVSHDFDLF